MQPYLLRDVSLAKIVVLFYFSRPTNGAVGSVSKKNGPCGLYHFH